MSLFEIVNATEAEFQSTAIYVSENRIKLQQFGCCCCKCGVLQSIVN